MAKGFYIVSKPKWQKIEKLIWDKDNAAIDKILERCPFNTINPLDQTNVANALLYEGNIIIQEPNE